MTRENPAKIQPRWFGYLAIALVFAMACLLLSNWQFARRAEAASAVRLVELNYDAPAAPGSAYLGSLTNFDRAHTWRPIILEGHYLVSYASLVRNRVQNNEAGFDSVVPFQLNDGRVLVVDRGWFPAAAGDVPATAVELPTDHQTQLTVRLRVSEPSISGQSSTATSIPTLHVPELAARWAAPTYTAIYGELVSEEPAVGAHGVLSPKPQLTEGNHLSYAFQWIAFAILGFVGLSWIVRRERQIARGDRRSGATKKRKSLDEEQEDNLIASQLL